MDLINLPYELIHIILRYLNNKDLIHASYTCKWLRLPQGEVDIRARLVWSSSYINDLIERQDFRGIKFIRSKGMVLNYNSMSCAFRQGNLDIIIYLLEQGLTCDTRDIVQASLYGHLHILEYVYENNLIKDWQCVDISIVDACELGNMDMLKFLLCIGVCNYTSYPIEKASEKGHLNMIEYLHSMKYKSSEQAVWNACKNGNLEIVKFLYKIGSTCDVADAIEIATRFKQVKIVEFLNTVTIKPKKVSYL